MIFTLWNQECSKATQATGVNLNEVLPMELVSMILDSFKGDCRFFASLHLVCRCWHVLLASTASPVNIAALMVTRATDLYENRYALVITDNVLDRVAETNSASGGCTRIIGSSI